MDNHRTPARWTNEEHLFSGKTGWLGVALPCAMVALGIYGESPVLSGLGAAVLLVQALGYRKWLADRALVAAAQASTDWIPARLDHEQSSDGWGWKLDVSLPNGTSVWMLKSTGDFRKELPLSVEVCDLEDDVVVIRCEDRLVLTRVESRG